MNIETNLPLESLLNLILNHALSSIGAKAGSLMTVNKKRGILQIRSRLGAPKKGRIGEPEYPINGISIASKAVNTKKIIIKNDLSNESLGDYVPSRSENKIQSIISVPIIHEKDVIAVINADSEEQNFFDVNCKNDLEKIAIEVAPLIAERISFLEALKEVSIELSKSPSKGDVDDVLQKIANVAVKSLGIDIVTLYEYNQEKDEFIIEKGGPKIGGGLNDESKMRNKVEREDVPYRVLEMRDEPLYYKKVKDVDFLSKSIKRPDNRLRFIDRENIKSMAALLLPNRAYSNKDEEIVGVIFANYKKEHDFNVDEQDALATFADYAATAILNSRKEKQRKEEVKVLERAKKAEHLKSVLDTMANAVMGKFDQQTVLKSILQTTMDILQSEACSIYFEDVENEPGLFKCIAGAGFAENIVGVAEYKLGEGLTGTIAKEGEEINIRTKNDLNEFKSRGKWEGKFDKQQWGKTGEFKNLIAVPIRLKNKIIGVIKVENKKSYDNTTFTNDDLESLKIIGIVIGLTFENVRLQNKIETQLKSISAQAAHRINNQLTNFANIEMDLRGVLGKSNIDELNIRIACDQILKYTEGLKKLVNEIKSFGKPLRLNLEICSINRIIKDEAWYAKPEKDLIIDTSNLDENIPEFLIDPVHFPESIKEMINNSAKIFKKKGIHNCKIIFTSKLIDYKNGKWAFISIEDNGPGFPENVQILEPYVTTYADSTGLGLATVKEVVEKHGGELKTKKSKMNGACIEIYLPIKKGDQNG